MCDKGATAAAPSGGGQVSHQQKNATASVSASAAPSELEITGPMPKKVSDGMVKLLRDRKGRQEYNEFLSSKATLEQELQRKEQAFEEKTREIDELRSKKDEEIAELRQKLSARERNEDVLVRTFESRHKSWLEQSSRHTVRIHPYYGGITHQG